VLCSQKHEAGRQHCRYTEEKRKEAAYEATPAKGMIESLHEREWNVCVCVCVCVCAREREKMRERKRSEIASTSR